MNKFYIYIIFISLKLFSFEGEIYKVGADIVKVGDKVELNLETNEDLSIEELEKIISDNKSKLGSFHIISSKKHSENRFKLFGIYESIIKSQGFSIADNNFKINDLSLFSREDANRIQEFHVYQKKIEEKIGAKITSWIIFSVLGLIAMIVGIYLFANNKKRKRAEKIKKLKVQWKQSLDKASTRDDFEEIYKSKESLKKLFHIEKSSFFDELNKVQYKKVWDEADLRNVKNSFNSFRSNL